MTKNKTKPRAISRCCNSLNYKCDRTECIFCSHTNNGIYCGHHKKYVTAKEIRDCTDYKDRFS